MHIFFRELLKACQGGVLFLSSSYRFAGRSLVPSRCAGLAVQCLMVTCLECRERKQQINDTSFFFFSLPFVFLSSLIFPIFWGGVLFFCLLLCRFYIFFHVIRRFSPFFSRVQVPPFPPRFLPVSSLLFLFGLFDICCVPSFFSTSFSSCTINTSMS